MRTALNGSWAGREFGCIDDRVTVEEGSNSFFETFLISANEGSLLKVNKICIPFNYEEFLEKLC